MSIRHRKDYKDFSGGFNSRDLARKLAEIESPDMRNVIVNKAGDLESRPGVVRIINLPVYDEENPAPVTSLFEDVNKFGESYLYAFAGDTMHYCKLSSPTKTWVRMRDGFTLNSHFDFTKHAVINKVLMVNGNDGYFEIAEDNKTLFAVTPYVPTDEEAETIGSSIIPEAPMYIAYWKYRIWLANIVNYPDRVYFNQNDVEGNLMYNYFTGTSWLRSSSTKGEGITAIYPFRGVLLVFTPSTIRGISGDHPNNFEMSDISLSVGTVSQKSIQQVGRNLVFMGMDGVYMFDGQTAPYKVSQRIEPTLMQIPQGRHYRICSATWRNKYYLTIPTGQAGDELWWNRYPTPTVVGEEEDN